MTASVSPVLAIGADPVEARMKNRRMYPVKVVTKDPDYYVGRIMVGAFALIGLLSIVGVQFP